MVSSEELTLSAPLAVLSLVYAATGTALFLLRTSTIGQAETSSYSNCDSESQDIFHLMLDCPAFDSLRLAIFNHSTIILDLWSFPWGVALLFDLRPHP